MVNKVFLTGSLFSVCFNSSYLDYSFSNISLKTYVTGAIPIFSRENKNENATIIALVCFQKKYMTLINHKQT